MIEVNLLPGVKRRSRKSLGGGAASSLKSLKLPDFDRWILFIVAAWVIGIGGLAWLFLGTQAAAATLSGQIETAVADSTRYAATIAQTNELRQRRDTIAMKLEVIQQIDEGRYTWPHIMAELARALPDYTWLVSVAQMDGGATPSFQIDGRTGNNFALTRFMSNLEASPFIRGVRLLSTAQVQEQQTTLHQFALEARFEEPPPDRIETVPLFAADAEEVSDGTAAE
ncbi:MAG TPA: PilN domain-containing protein [Longimicrobiales bacterium]|nr:PilN domain-containing protein [Longimicrobiales bacterium]